MKLTAKLLKEMVTEAFQTILKEDYDDSQVEKIADMLATFEDDTIASAIQLMEVLDMGMLYEKASTTSGLEHS